MGKRNWQPITPSVDPFVDKAWNAKVQSIVDRMMHSKATSNIPTSQEVRMDDMQWVTKDGQRMLASQMETRHMYNAMILLHDKLVPEKYRLRLREDSDVPDVKVHSNENKKALQILIALITVRLQDPARDKEFTDGMLEGLELLIKNAKQLL